MDIMLLPILIPFRELEILQHHHHSRRFADHVEATGSSGFIGTNQEYHTEHKLYHPDLMNQVKAHQKKAVPLIDYTSTCLFQLKLRTGQI
jgi:hypothetical protein